MVIIIIFYTSANNLYSTASVIWGIRDLMKTRLYKIHELSNIYLFFSLLTNYTYIISSETVVISIYHDFYKKTLIIRKPDIVMLTNKDGMRQI